MDSLSEIDAVNEAGWVGEPKSIAPKHISFRIYNTRLCVYTTLLSSCKFPQIPRIPQFARTTFPSRGQTYRFKFLKCVRNCFWQPTSSTQLPLPPLRRATVVWPRFISSVLSVSRKSQKVFSKANLLKLFRQLTNARV